MFHALARYPVLNGGDAASTFAFPLFVFTGLAHSAWMAFKKEAA